MMGFISLTEEYRRLWIEQAEPTHEENQLAATFK
jgi:hypothetical protein